MLLEPGCMVPADCLLIAGEDISVDELKYSDDRVQVKKTIATEDNDSKYPDPFLLSNTFVLTGSGRAVVCAVGATSRRGSLDDKLDTTSKTKLQEKLENLGHSMTRIGIYSALVILTGSIFRWIIGLIADPTTRDFGTILDTLAKCFTQFVAIIIVAIPEGLPLTVTLSLAYSVMRMKKDGVLIKDLGAPEIMGRIDQILIGKTGTLTKGEFKVTDFFVQNKVIKNQRANTLFNTDLKEEVVDLIHDSIVYNCDARIEMNDKAYYEPVGNNTECSLLKFLQDADIPVHENIKGKIGFTELNIPFSPVRKNSIVAIKYVELGIIRVFVKGAPEAIVLNSTSFYDENGEVNTLDEESQHTII